jgi:hypothetical protein
MKATFALVLIVLAYLTVSTADYNDKAAAAEERAAKRKTVPATEPAPIWSKKCLRKEQDVIVKRADMGPWTIHCVPRRVLTVSAS